MTTRGTALRSGVLAMLALGAATACSGQTQDADTAPTATTAAAPAGQAEAKLYCMLDAAAPAPCTMTDSVDADNVHAMRFTVGSTVVHFRGTTQTGWWSGTLDGRAAMGYELNRGHTVYSTRDLGTRFEWWYAGMQHGNY